MIQLGRRLGPGEADAVELSGRRAFLVQEAQRLEGSTDQGLGVQAQPLLQDRGVDAAEIHVVQQVAAVLQVPLLQRRVLPVEAALHGVAYDPAGPAGAVVRPTAVVPGPPAELAEHEQEDFIPSVMLSQVLVEVGHSWDTSRQRRAWAPAWLA